MNSILNFLIKLDMVVFQVITLGKAKKNETISAAAYEGERTGKIMGRIFRPVIDFLFIPFQKQHCKEAWLWQISIYQGDQ